MPWYVYTHVLVLLAGFAGGWAFYKHRAEVKAKAVDVISKA